MKKYFKKCKNSENGNPKTAVNNSCLSSGGKNPRPNGKCGTSKTSCTLKADVACEKGGAVHIGAKALFFIFFKIGLFTFGGGYAMIPMIERELSQKRKLLDEDEILDIVALSESTPGPIAVNMATFVGSRSCGVLGAVAATLGVVLPSFSVILLVSAVLRRFEEIRAVKAAFFGVRAAVLALILRALYTMLRQCPKSAFSLIVAFLSFLAVAVFSQNALPVLLASAALGIIYSALTAKKDERERQKK